MAEVKKSYAVLNTGLVRSVATASWIDQRLFPKLPEVDFNSTADYCSGGSVTREFLLGQTAYRFCNFLEAAIKVVGGAIKGFGFTDASEMYRAKSFPSTAKYQRFGIASQTYPAIRKCIVAAKSVTFLQTVGCRTQSPEKIAEAAGMFFGGSGPLGYVGERVGRLVIESILIFPPIWSTLSMRIDLDGKVEAGVVHQSHFPSLSFFREAPAASGLYAQDDAPYDARPYRNDWMTTGWGQGNPWNVAKPQGLRELIHPQAPASEGVTGSLRHPTQFN